MLIMPRRVEQGDQTEIEAFLSQFGLRDPVRMGKAERNGHSILGIWTGERIRANEINEKLILKSGRTGCLEITDGSVRKTIFVEAGKIVRETTKPEPMDPRQKRMI